MQRNDCYQTLQGSDPLPPDYTDMFWQAIPLAYAVLLQLFNYVVLSVLLCGCEMRNFKNIASIEKVHLKTPCIWKIAPHYLDIIYIEWEIKK